MPFLARGCNPDRCYLDCTCNLIYGRPGKSDCIMRIVLRISANKTRKDTRPIYICIIYDRLHQNKVNTGIEVLPDQWDVARQKVVNHPAAKVYNASLATKVSEIKDRIAKEFENKRLDELRLLPKKMQQTLGLNQRRKPTPKPIDFLVYMVKSISESTELKYSSVVAQMSVYHRLYAFYGELPFDKLNHAWLLDFERRCLEANLSRGTIWKYHKDIKKYLHRAALEGVYTYPQGKHPYAGFRVQRAYHHRDHLTTKELQKLESAELSPALDRVRRMFLFLCYTGLRIILDTIYWWISNSGVWRTARRVPRSPSIIRTCANI